MLTKQQTPCYHCGEYTVSATIRIGEKIFCCQGCKMVYEILQENALCDYYSLNESPGISQRSIVRRDKFAFLDEEKIAAKLINYKDEKHTHVTFYLPQMHCSSCLYLLENLHRIDAGIISSKVNFIRKEVSIVLQSSSSSVRKAAELLTSIGYEPYISLHDLHEKRSAINKSMVYQLGVAGFCFGNIMLMSFPEYLGIDASETGLRDIFRWLNFVLAVPVFLYSAFPFYESSWKSLRHKFLNIDAPIALAIIITFVRSAWEVATHTGGGYFDSMTGIVFFMLAGRILQDKTYRQLSFERDYTSYFPIAVSVLKENNELPTALPDIKPGDTLLVHNGELIPADGILTRGKGFIDYSFVTGESLPVVKEIGELVYAGGKQTGGNIEILVIKEVAQSYLTGLWNKEEYSKEESKQQSFVHIVSRYFTYIVFAIAIITAVYWYWNGPAHIWPAVTAIFIIACPCALLLSNSFTNGNILRILGRNRFYLKNAQSIEQVAKVDHIVFDKTGTLTSPGDQHITYTGEPLTGKEQQLVAAIAACSGHPLSKTLCAYIERKESCEADTFREITGEGVEGTVGGKLIRLGSCAFVSGTPDKSPGTKVFVSIDDKVKGCFCFSNQYRQDIVALVQRLKKRYTLSVITGDSIAEKANLESMFGRETTLLFNQQPADKLQYIKQLQRQGKTVMMIGDGLNDAGALKQSDLGIAVAEQSNNFTPSSDAIIEARQLSLLPRFTRLCRANKRIVVASFILSILYNIAGLYFAVQGNLSPLVAAILMPASSFSILLITFGSTTLFGRYLDLE